MEAGEEKGGWESGFFFLIFADIGSKRGTRRHDTTRNDTIKRTTLTPVRHESKGLFSKKFKWPLSTSRTLPTFGPR